VNSLLLGHFDKRNCGRAQRAAHCLCELTSFRLQVQRCTLLSIKTGGCPENCGYCSQSSHHKDVDLKAEKLMDLEDVYEVTCCLVRFHADAFCHDQSAVHK
jgi:biotin synthase-like enzyme